jgi:L-arabinose isomerase
VAEGPTHHFALGIGHHARSLARIAQVLGVECAWVTPHEEWL